MSDVIILSYSGSDEDLEEANGGELSKASDWRSDSDLDEIVSR